MASERTPAITDPDYEPPRRVSPAEARRFAEVSDRRYEYWHGLLYARGYPPGSHWAMSGGTLAHSLVIVETLFALRAHLVDGPCRVYDSNVALHVSATDYCYPDAFVSCAPLADPYRHAQHDATLVVEVLSPRTADFDRTGKFDACRRLPGLREYLLLESRYMRADLFRHDRDLWTQTVILPDASLPLASIGLTIPLAALYARTGVPRTLEETIQGDS